MLGQLFLINAIILAIVSPILGLTADEEWGIWKEEHGKRYEDEQDELKIREIWEENRSQINLHNFEYIMGLRSYTLGLNSYSDMHLDELKKTSRKRNYLKELERMLLGSKLGEDDLTNKRTYQKLYEPDLEKRMPDSVDWRSEGYVNEVRNQGQCGSSWAFSATGSMAGQIFRKTGILPRLSPQQLIDCTKMYGNEGCHGGRVVNAFRYMRDEGVVSETGYPYFATSLGYCYFNKQYLAGSANGFVEIPSGDENALKTAVATVGPISAWISVYNSFLGYKSGVYNQSACGKTRADLNHVVLIVGYGTENGQDYWLVQNSWGTQWGDDGYIKMARNLDNQCGIATAASYPLV